MHCIEVEASRYAAFKNSLARFGVTSSIISRYTDGGVRLLDVEVSTENKKVELIEKRFAYGIY